MLGAISTVCDNNIVCNNWKEVRLNILLESDIREKSTIFTEREDRQTERTNVRWTPNLRYSQTDRQDRQLERMNDRQTHNFIYSQRERQNRQSGRMNDRQTHNFSYSQMDRQNRQTERMNDRRTYNASYSQTDYMRRDSNLGGSNTIMDNGNRWSGFRNRQGIYDNEHHGRNYNRQPQRRGCYNCGEYNHIQRNCRYDHEVKCVICNEYGHKSRFCTNNYSC